MRSCPDKKVGGKVGEMAYVSPSIAQDQLMKHAHERQSSDSSRQQSLKGWRAALLIALVAVAVIVGFSWLRHGSAAPQSPMVSPATVAAGPTNGATTPSALSSSAQLQNVTNVGAIHQRFTTDGKDTNSIRLWAHNELEVQRMLDENDRIYRRQLVVLKETVGAVVERNRLSGETIRQLSLPGLDGQEIAFEVKRADIEPSGLRGMFHGIVAGRPDSMVTLAFKNRTQAFTILSPSDNLYLDVEPHDPGDVIVKSIDLAKYGAGLCGVK
jgi:hypothetical protein